MIDIEKIEENFSATYPCSLCGEKCPNHGLARVENKDEGTYILICQSCVSSLDSWFINHPPQDTDDLQRQMADDAFTGNLDR